MSMLALRGAALWLALATQLAVPFEGEENLASLLAPFLRRTMAVEMAGPVRRVGDGQDAAGSLDARVWIYRLENPQG